MKSTGLRIIEKNGYILDECFDGEREDHKVTMIRNKDSEFEIIVFDWYLNFEVTTAGILVFHQYDKHYDVGLASNLLMFSCFNGNLLWKQKTIMGEIFIYDDVINVQSPIRCVSYSLDGNCLDGAGNHVLEDCQFEASKFLEIIKKTGVAQYCKTDNSCLAKLIEIANSEKHNQDNVYIVAEACRRIGEIFELNSRPADAFEYYLKAYSINHKIGVKQKLVKYIKTNNLDLNLLSRAEENSRRIREALEASWKR